jgi:hypothetical protein
MLVSLLSYKKMIVSLSKTVQRENKKQHLADDRLD